MKHNGGELQPGSRKHISDAQCPSTPPASSMWEWYPDLSASVTWQFNTGRSKATSYWTIGRELGRRGLPSIGKLEAEFSHDN